MPIDIRALRYFVETARLRSFTQAATSLYVTQSTISKMVRQLEDEVGQPLLIREDYVEEIRKLGLEPLSSNDGSFCGVPLLLYERPIGVMVLQSPQERGCFRAAERIETTVARRHRETIGLTNGRARNDLGL